MLREVVEGLGFLAMKKEKNIKVIICLIKSDIVMCAEMVRTTKWLVNHVI